MPYIKLVDRATVWEEGPVNVGELNFLITDICIQFLETSDKRYSDYNDIIGVLECAKQEFYRRMVVPYEEQKIKDNTDVYPTQENKNEQA